MQINIFLKGLIQNRFLIQSMILKEIKQRYSGSVLGISWILLQPLTMILIYTFVFSVVLKAKLGPEYGGLNFSVWLVAGLIPWMFFNEVLNRSSNVLLDNTSLLKKTLVDPKMIIFSSVGSPLVNFFIFLVVFSIILLYFKIHFFIHIFAALIYIFLLLCFSIGLLFALSSLNVYLRDIGQFLGVFLNIWFYLTPIIYPIQLIPDRYRIFIEMNPLYHYIEGFRSALITTQPINISSMFYCFLFSVLSLSLGRMIYKKLKEGFVDVL